MTRKGNEDELRVTDLQSPRVAPGRDWLAEIDDPEVRALLKAMALTRPKREPPSDFEVRYGVRRMGTFWWMSRYMDQSGSHE